MSKEKTPIAHVLEYEEISLNNYNGNTATRLCILKEGDTDNVIIKDSMLKFFLGQVEAADITKVTAGLIIRLGECMNKAEYLKCLADELEFHFSLDSMREYISQQEW